jgi:hypothetical protein
MSAADIARGLRARRSGKNWVARCPAHRDHTPSLSITEGRDGRPLVHCHSGCSQADVIGALRPVGLWPEHEPRREYTPAERREWGRQQREMERHLADARHWRCAAVAMAEEVLCNLKCALFDPMQPQPGPNEIADWTSRLAAWQRMDGAELVAEYRAWLERNPTWARSLVKAGRSQQRRLQVALAEFITEELSVGTAA